MNPSMTGLAGVGMGSAWIIPGVTLSSVTNVSEDPLVLDPPEATLDVRECDSTRRNPW